MPLEPNKYLYDIQEAASRIVGFTYGKTLDDYRANAMLRSAVERQFDARLRARFRRHVHPNREFHRDSCLERTH